MSLYDRLPHDLKQASNQYDEIFGYYYPSFFSNFESLVYNRDRQGKSPLGRMIEYREEQAFKIRIQEKERRFFIGLLNTYYTGIDEAYLVRDKSRIAYLRNAIEETERKIERIETYIPYLRYCHAVCEVAMKIENEKLDNVEYLSNLIKNTPAGLLKQGKLF